MKEKVQWGIVGTGQIAADLAISLERSTRGRIVNACGSSPGKARAFAERWRLPRAAASLEELLAERGVDGLEGRVQAIARDKARHEQVPFVDEGAFLVGGELHERDRA